MQCTSNLATLGWKSNTIGTNFLSPDKSVGESTWVNDGLVLQVVLNEVSGDRPDLVDIDQEPGGRASSRTVEG